MFTKILKIINIFAILLLVLATGIILGKTEFWSKNSANIMQAVTWLILSITAYFIYRYWKETQEMKKEMVKQNKLHWKGIRVSSMPVIDFQIEGPPPSNGGYTYDVFIVNKGGGPAFNVIAHSIPSSMTVQQGPVMSH